MQRKSQAYQTLAGLAMLTTICCGQRATTYTVNYAVTGLMDGTSITLQGNGATLATITQNGGPFQATSASASGFSLSNGSTAAQQCLIGSVSQPDAAENIGMLISCSSTSPGTTSSATGSGGLQVGAGSNLTANPGTVVPGNTLPLVNLSPITVPVAGGGGAGGSTVTIPTFVLPGTNIAPLSIPVGTQ